MFVLIELGYCHSPIGSTCAYHGVVVGLNPHHNILISIVELDTIGVIEL